MTNEPDADGQKRTLVLDNLIHGYFILGHPERLDYDYEHIYGLVAHRVAAAKAKATGKSNASQAPAEDALPRRRGLHLPALHAAQVPRHRGRRRRDRPGRHPGQPHGARASPPTPRSRPTWGDARQFVERNQGDKQYDIVFGDAFNDFSVPWHLTTREFNDKLAKMLAPDGVYMINIIDAYESDAKAAEKAEKRIKKRSDHLRAGQGRPSAAHELARGHKYGGFLGVVGQDRQADVPAHLHLRDRRRRRAPASARRSSSSPPRRRSTSTTSAAATTTRSSSRTTSSSSPGRSARRTATRSTARSRGIILTDDYAPVENLLAPVAETRGDDD